MDGILSCDDDDDDDEVSRDFALSFSISNSFILKVLKAFKALKALTLFKIRSYS